MIAISDSLSMSSLPLRKLLVDTDPGGDDAIALLWLQSLVRQGLTELVAVTTAQGNVNGSRTFTSACQLLQLGGCAGVEVARAVADPPGALPDARHIHGADGMGDLSATLPASRRDWQTAPSADDTIIDALTQSPGEITVVGLAPLSNLAAAEAKRPGILKLAKEVVLMLGAFERQGNITPLAEFNAAYDPQAAQSVLESGANLVVLPLDVTQELIFRRQTAREMRSRAPESAIAVFVDRLCEFMTETALRYRETAGIEGFLVHDAVTVAYLFYPETLKFRRAEVRIETEGCYSAGYTFIDRRHGAKLQANAFVGCEVNRQQLLAILRDDLQQLIA
jgi:inosine-uridine nucleoside N-ribohydrolase